MIETSGPTAVYVRISEDRDGERLGVERQLADCRKLAKRLGWAVGEVYEDNDISASKRGVVRPAYQRLLADIEAGKVRRLVTDKPDRLYRRNTELERLIDIVGDRVEIRTAKAGDIDLSTTTGRMVARILGATAQAEAETIRDRVRRKMLELRTAGKWKGGPRPFGWTVVDKRLVEKPDEIALLREAKDRVLAGEAVYAIAQDWRRRGVRSTRGSVLGENVLRRMLASPRLVGEYADGIKGDGWEPVLSREEWEELNIVLRGRTRRRSASKKYLLVGLLTCGLCGHRMYGRPNYRRGKAAPSRDYVCHPATLSNACGKVAIRESIADEYVMRKLCDFFTSPKWQVIRDMQEDAPTINAAVLALGRVQAKLDDLATAYGAGKVTMGEWLTAKRGLDPALRTAQGALEAARKQAMTQHKLASLDADHFVKHWQDMDLASRRTVAEALLIGVEVNPVADERSARIVMFWR